MIDPTRVRIETPLASTAKAVAAPQAKEQAESATVAEPADQFEGMVKVKVFPQDPLVGPTETILLPKDIIGDRLTSTRIKTQDRAPIAIADTDGNYDYEVGTPQFDQVNAHAIVANTLFMYDKVPGTAGRVVFRWSAQGHPSQRHRQDGLFQRTRRLHQLFRMGQSQLGQASHHQPSRRRDRSRDRPRDLGRPSSARRLFG